MSTFTEMSNLSLAEIQRTLKVPKSQYNSFGKYHFRKCEDILEAVKPLLGDATLTISDEIVDVGGRIYVKATAIYNKNGNIVSVSGYAREANEKKKMDCAQITGAASSYARKYALNGLFCIDDTADPDNHGNGTDKTDSNSLETPTELDEGADQDKGYLGYAAAMNEMRTYVKENRDGVYNGDLSNQDFWKMACKSSIGRVAKNALEVRLVIDDLRAGRLSWENGEKFLEE